MVGLILFWIDQGCQGWQSLAEAPEQLYNGYLEVPESHVLPLDVEALREELGDLAHRRPPAERRVVRVVTLRRLSLGCDSME